MRRRRCHVGRGGRSVAGRMGKAGSAGGRREAGRGGRWAAPRPPAPARSPRPRCAPSPGPQPGPRAPASRPPHRPQGAPPQRRGLVFILGVSWSQGTLPGLGEGCAPRGGGRGGPWQRGKLGACTAPGFDWPWRGHVPDSVSALGKRPEPSKPAGPLAGASREARGSFIHSTTFTEHLPSARGAGSTQLDQLRVGR